MKKIYKPLLVTSAILALSVIGILIFGKGLSVTGPFVIGAFVCLAIGGGGTPKIRQMSFTIWVLAAVCVGMYLSPVFSTNR